MDLPSLGRLQADETIQLLDPDSVRPWICFFPWVCLAQGGMYSFSLRLNSYILWLGWAARPVQSLHGVYSLHCLMKEQVSYWWPPKRQRGKKKSTLLSILWITSFGCWYPLKVACPGSQRVTGHRHSWSIHTTVFLTQLVADPRLLHLQSSALHGIWFVKNPSWMDGLIQSNCFFLPSTKLVSRVSLWCSWG